MTLNDNDHTSDDAILHAERLLSQRPSFSIRFRIIVAFTLAFLFSLGITLTSIIFILKLDAQQNFLDSVRQFNHAIQEARRAEKNYFIYHSESDLYDALNGIHQASKVLKDYRDEMTNVITDTKLQSLAKSLNHYQEIIDNITHQKGSDLPTTGGRLPSIRENLRFNGHQLLLLATDIESKEREKVRVIAKVFTIVAIASVIVNLLVMLWLATELTRQILQPLGRAVGYTQRIAAGDFSLITPMRSYRDEFSNLAIAINRMIRELRQKQDQLVQSRKMAAIGTLTSGIAHELNNPLNNISITLEALMECGEDYDEQQKNKMLNDCFIEVERASSTVRNLLDFTRLESTKKESIDVGNLVDSSLKLVSNELKINNVVVKQLIPHHTFTVKANYRNLQQVFLNLFVNSIQAMPDGGTLQIEAHRQDSDRIRIDVTDTGCGIAQEHISKIFDPFFTTKSEGQGTGLGLSVSYGIVQKHGGKLTVQSALGKGTTFQIELPLHNPVEQDVSISH